MTQQLQGKQSLFLRTFSVRLVWPELKSNALLDSLSLKVIIFPLQN